MYRYSALTSDHSIRLIELLSSRNTDAPVSIRLAEAFLDNPLKFEALSYAWEGQVPDSLILCNGETLLITKTCLAALRRLRRKFRNRFLWIDAICINQYLNEEKNQQVAIMSEVYTKAARVIVWLGDHFAGDLLLKYVHYNRLHSLLKVLNNFPWISEIHNEMGEILRERWMSDMSSKLTLVENLVHY